MSKKNNQDQLMAKIKEMESLKRDAVPQKIEEDVVVSFDTWYHQKKDKIPKRHMKEIIIADFKARGLGIEATVEQFDKALALYGIKL